MTSRHDVSLTLPWMRDGTGHLLTAVEKLSDGELRLPSVLPGWTRAHIVGHVARNAEALTRLATWARTGVETPMYADQAQRATEIDRSAALPAAVLRSQAATTAHLLDETLAALDDTGWSATVRSALGRIIPATEIPWMRVREVWLHAVDLDTGTTVNDLPNGAVDLLLDDAATVLSGKEGCPAVVLAPVDRDRTWHLGGAHTQGGRPTVTARAAELAGWLTGRVPGAALPGQPPALPPWI